MNAETPQPRELESIELSNQIDPSNSNNLNNPARVISPEFRRSLLFEKLAKTIHQNELGLPKYLYRCDMVLPDLDTFPQKTQNAILASAVIEITYREGFPTFLDGNPIWEQMIHESDEDYCLFEEYRNLQESLGYRSLSALPLQISQVTLQELQETANLYFWYPRIKAYDLFILSVHRKRREQRMMQIENYHYAKSHDLLERMLTQVNTVFATERVGAMTPDDFVKTIRSLTEIQRTSIGLMGPQGGNGKTGEGAPPPGATLEVTMRSIARQSGASDQNESGQGGTGAILDFKNNPEALLAAQELIIKVKSGGRQANNVNERVQAGDEAQDLAMIHGDSD